MKRILMLISLVLFSCTSVQKGADRKMASDPAAIKYVDMLKSLSNGKKVVSEIPNLAELYNAEDLGTASGTLTAIRSDADAAQTAVLSTQNEQANGVTAAQVFEKVRQKQITFVLVPGLLGEFIETRAFEEIFKRNSAARAEWKNMTQNAGTDSRFMDERFSLKNYNLTAFDAEARGAADVSAIVPTPLSDLIDVASVDGQDGKPLFKLIILKTLIGSLESVGDNAKIAAIFNRRLQKYFDVSNDQNDVVLLGYSRGTPLSLEMVTQAQTTGLGYLSKVKTLVSYAGVVMGSSLADSAMIPTSENGRLKAAIEKFYNDLRTTQQAGGTAARIRHNLASFATFVRSLQQGNTVKNEEASKANPLSEFVMSGDLRSVGFLIASVAGQLGWDGIRNLSISNLFDHDNSIVRLKKMITEILKSVDGLRTESMTKWWATHTLPKHIQYLSLAAFLEDGAYDKNSLDDKGLMGNKRSYLEASDVYLNDSQVSIPQALFLPKLISGLNAGNSDLKIGSLGLLRTHHWGVSLQVVNKMRNGALNQFPREKVLTALAGYLNQ